MKKIRDFGRFRVEVFVKIGSKSGWIPPPTQKFLPGRVEKISDLGGTLNYLCNS